MELITPISSRPTTPTVTGKAAQPGLLRPSGLEERLKADIVEVQQKQAERVKSQSRLSKVLSPIRNFFSGLLDRIKSLGSAIRAKFSKQSKAEQNTETKATELISTEDATKAKGKTSSKIKQAKPEKFKKGSVMKGVTRMIQKSFSLRGVAAWAVAILTGFTVPLPLKYFLEGYLGYSSLLVNRKYSRLPVPFSHVVTSNKGIDTRSALSAWRERKA